MAKHRVFAWFQWPVITDDQTVVFAREDDCFFGVLHSRVHEVWTRVQGTQLRERESGFRYTPSSCFETFPFPDPTDKQRNRIWPACSNAHEITSPFVLGGIANTGRNG